MKPRRFFHIAIIFSLFMLCFSHAVAQEQPILFWTALPEPDHTVMETLVQEYNQQNPNKPVQYTNFSNPKELLQTLQNGNLPDLALIDSRWIGTLASKLVPAHEMLKNAGDMVETVAQVDTFSNIWNACVYEGKIYAIPFSAETSALVLNQKFFKHHPSIQTLSLWEKISLKAAQGKNFGIVLPVFWNPEDFAQLWLDFSATFKPNPHIPGAHEALKALNVWWNWVNRIKLSTLDASTNASRFNEGSTWILLPRDVASLKSAFWVEPLPRAKYPWGFLRVQAIAFFSKQNSWNFANFLTDYPRLKYWALNTPTVPVNKQVYLNPDYLQHIHAKGGWMRVFIDEVQHAALPLNSPNSLSILSKTGKILLQSLKKQISEQEAVKQIQILLHSTSFVKVISCA
jgi:ABC-type glycerol-3-phosphate transport system substrate-binding protein